MSVNPDKQLEMETYENMDVVSIKGKTFKLSPMEVLHQKTQIDSRNLERVRI